jgi:hypothetical protein
MTRWVDRSGWASCKATGSTGARRSGSATRGAVILSCLQLTYPNMCSVVQSSYLSLIRTTIFLNTVVLNSEVDSRAVESVHKSSDSDSSIFKTPIPTPS